MKQNELFDTLLTPLAGARGILRQAQDDEPRAARKPNLVNDFLWHFKMMWEKKYPKGKFTITGKQYGQAKNLLAPVKGFEPMTVDEARARVNVFIANDGFKICSHAFNKLIEHWDMCIPQDRPGYKPEREINDPVMEYCCPKCKTVERGKRSAWERFRNKKLACRNCGQSYPVNDVLNQPLTIQNYLPT